MRPERTVQASIFDLFAQHEIGCELKKALYGAFDVKRFRPRWLST